MPSLLCFYLPLSSSPPPFNSYENKTTRELRKSSAASKETSLGKHSLWTMFGSLKFLIRHLGTGPCIYLGEGQKKRKPNMLWGDFLIVAVISGEFIFLVPGPRVFLNHYGMWFPAMDERLLRRNTPVCSKIKKNTCYLFLLSLLDDWGGGQFVPRGWARGNFQVSVCQRPSCTHTKSCVHPQPTCQRWTRGDEGTLSGDPLSAAAPLAEPQTPRMMLLHGNSLPKGCGARKESAQEKAPSP